MSVYLQRIEKEYENNPEVKDFLAEEYNNSPVWDRNLTDREAKIAQHYDDLAAKKEHVEKSYKMHEKVFKYFEIALTGFLMCFLVFTENLSDLVKVGILIGYMLVIIFMEDVVKQLYFRLLNLNKEINSIMYPEFTEGDAIVGEDPSNAML